MPFRTIARKTAREWRRWRRRGTRDRLPPGEPPPVLGKDPVELHTLVCARDVPMSLWSLRSFIGFSGLAPSVVVHDDGTLTEAHRDLYRRCFDGIVVLDGAGTSATLDEALGPWPTCRRLRRTPAFYCARKLFDLLFFARGETVLYVDSDVLFFRRPDALLAHLAAGSPCFGSDHQDAYSLPLALLERWAGHRVQARINGGLLHVPVAPYRSRLDRIEAFLAHAERESREPDVNRHEQTAHALILSELGAARLPPAYRLIGLTGPLDAEAVSGHFIGEGDGRKAFWDEGVTRVERGLGAGRGRRGRP